MLYVFHVDVGRMMSFDMTVALSSVENLKATIERLHNIPAANIVLLVSGGEMLIEGTQVSCYSAGTDTNPIYMFLTGEYRLPATTIQTDNELDLCNQVELSMELPAVYETVIARAQLASRMYEFARDEDRLCERLVHDQHLQQQGWSAVIANLEDVTNEFCLRLRNFITIFDSHLSKRSFHIELIENFNADLLKLSRIPILPGLMPQAQADFHAFDEVLNNDEVFSRSQQESVLETGADTATASPAAAIGGDTVTSDASDQLSNSPNKKPKMAQHDTENTTQKLSIKNSKEKSSNASNTSSQSGAVYQKTKNLLDWITSKENHNALRNMCIECIHGLHKFTPELYEHFRIEIANVVRIAEEGNVKEIKGLGERLMRLEEFKYKIKDMVNDQKELSTSFQQNQNRAINLRDPSILPDLCESHCSQLNVMLTNHKKIIEMRRCIAKAKDELGANLHTRLARIIVIENTMSDFDNRMLFYYRCLRRAERHIEIIEQIHQAPCIYVAAVTEVVRRKIFSEEFRTWASKLCDDFDAIHSEEIKRREIFNASFEGHFLNILFPGMNDMPPMFANENPLTFDTRLPNITKSDIDILSSQLPDLAALIKLPDMQPVIRFFVSRSGEHQKSRWEQMLKDEAMELGSTTNFALMEKPQNQRVLELQREAAATAGSSRTSGCDVSETDTEIEFEKVSPSTDAAPLDNALDTTQLPNAAAAIDETQQKDAEPLNTLDRSTITECRTFNNAETLTDENDVSTREELERLRESLKMLSQHSMDCLRLARSNLATVRADAETYREDIQTNIQSLKDTCKMLQLRSEAKDQEFVQEKQAKQLEIDDLKTKLCERDAEIDKLKEELENSSSLQIKYAALEEKMLEMRQKIEHEKETAVALAREELIHEQKTEIESLRCRFKLMTSMERSPSDMSLEKIERPISRNAAAGPDEPSIPEMTHIQKLEALKIQFEADKEKAVIAAVEAERSLWQSKLMLNSESVIANVSMLKVIEEKERDIKLLRDREYMLTKENLQLKTRLDAITNEDVNSWLREKIEFLNRDKERLEKELEKTKRLEMDNSVAGLRGPQTEHVLSRAKSSSSSHKYAVLQSLDKGDVVFVVWSTTYGQYIVVQDSTSLFFVHGDSLAGLKLHLPKQRELESPSTSSGTNADELSIPMPYYSIGIVIDKEYCQARKDKNRYRVPCGSKFYRVKMAPVSIAQPIARVPRDRLESFSKSVSRSQSQCESQSEASCSTAAVGSALEASVMQTELTTSTAVSLSSPMQDTVDSSVSTHTLSASNRAEDEVTLLNERCRYASVSEEEELSLSNITTTTAPPQNQSVITEQPTASNKLKLDLRFSHNSADGSSSSNTIIGSDDTQKTKAQNMEGEMEATILPVVMEPETSTAATAAAAIVVSGTTTNEDSDEYRSLEGKEDDAEFGTFD